MDYGLDGKHALVTGGATGIGFAVAQAFVAEGARVTISGLNSGEVDTAVEQLGPHAQGLAGDLTHADDARELYAFASLVAPVDFLINSLGIFAVHDFFEISMTSGSDISMSTS